MMQIFIPYNSIGARWDELRYCLRSIDTHCPDAHITIYSTDEIPWIQNVEFDVVPRYRKDVPQENFWDTIYKMNMYSQTHKGEFLYVYDDMVFLKPFTYEDFYNIALQQIYPEDFKMMGDRHGRTVVKALNLLDMVGVNMYNYETHCPRTFYCEGMYQLFDSFRLLVQETPAAFSTMYYNYYRESPNQILAIRNDIRASFCFEESPESGSYIASSKSEIKKYSKGKFIIHYNDKGLRFAPNGTQILKEYISEMFPNPSKYEK